MITAPPPPGIILAQATAFHLQLLYDLKQNTKLYELVHVLMRMSCRDLPYESPVQRVGGRAVRTQPPPSTGIPLFRLQEATRHDISPVALS